MTPPFYGELNFSKDLDMYPSPYLSGEYDYLFKDNEDHKYQVIVETNSLTKFINKSFFNNKALFDFNIYI